MTGDSEARVEFAAALFADDVGDDLGGVGLGGLFVTEDDLSTTILTLVLGELLFQVLDV